MSKFSYKAVDNSGKIITGIIDEENKQDVLSVLKNKGFFPIEISQSKNPDISFDFLSRWKKISSKDKLSA